MSEIARINYLSEALLYLGALGLDNDNVVAVEKLLGSIPGTRPSGGPEPASRIMPG